jgi:hypothetical protein
MRAHEFIFEVVDIGGSPPDVKWSMDTDIEDKKPVHMATWKDPTGKDVRSMFKPNDAGTSASVFFDRPDKKGNPSFKITGTGGEQSAHVFSGAVSNVNTFLNQNPNIQSVSINSQEPSRSKLYARMIDRLAPQAGLVGSAIVVDPHSGETNFVLHRAKDDQPHQSIAKQVRDQMPEKYPYRRKPTPIQPNVDLRKSPPTGTGVNLTRPPRTPAATPVPVKPLSAASFKGGGGGRGDDYNDMASPDYSMGLDPSYGLTQMKLDQMNRLLKKSY